MGKQAQSPAPTVMSSPQAFILFDHSQKYVNIVDVLGVPITDGTLHRLGRVMHPQMADIGAVGDAEQISGTWLYAGDYWSHFGHFLFESMARLWALKTLDRPIDGLIFSSPRPAWDMEHRDPGFQIDLLRRVGADLPVKIVANNCQVENLIVPKQGCGIGSLAGGTPEFRDFIREGLRDGIKPGPHERVYISRAGYGLRRGGLFAEGRIEQLLAADGYVPFRPERASMGEQISTYLGAKKIVAPDSTALHLVAFLAKEDQDIAVLLRREEGMADLLPNIVGCTQKMPLIVNRIKRIHQRDNMAHPNWSKYAELDFERVGQDLAAGGFIQDATVWSRLGFRRQRWLLSQYGQKLACGFESQEVA